MTTIEEKISDPQIPLIETMIAEDWMTPKEVGDLFGVKQRTIIRWCESYETFGSIRSFKTPGGHRRYYKPDVKRVLDAYLTESK